MDENQKPAENSDMKIVNWRWGYVIVVCRFTIMFLDGGIAKSFGVLIPEMVYHMDETYANVGLICSMPGTLMYLCCPLVSLILERTNRRLVAFIGGTMSGVCLVLCAFFTNTLVVGVCLSLTGIGLACMYMPLTLVVKEFFPDNFILMNTITMYGYTAGTVILPFITERSQEAYGYAGTFLILGGITLNTVVCAVAIRSPIWKETGEGHHQKQRHRHGPCDVQARVQDKARVKGYGWKNTEDKLATGPLKTRSRQKKNQASEHTLAKYTMETCTSLESLEDNMSEQAFGSDIEKGTTERLPLIDNNAGVDHYPGTSRDIPGESNASLGGLESCWKTLLCIEPLVWFNLLTIFLFGYVIYSWMLFLVPHAEQLDITESRAVFLSSIAGIGGIIGRTIFITLVAKDVNKFYIVMIVIAAGIINTISFLIDFIGSEYSIRAGLAFFQGLSFFVEDSMLFIIAEALFTNQNNFSLGIALLSLFYGLGATSAGYVSGLLFDITQSYTKVFIINGIVHAVIVAKVIITTTCLRKRETNIDDGQE